MEQELDDEVRSFLDLVVEEKRRAGFMDQEARRLALLELGGLEQVKEQVRSVRAGAALEGLGRDLSYAVRGLTRDAGFTTVAVFTLALGIGANAAIFSAVYSVLLKPLPFESSDRLVAIWKKNPPRGWVRNPISAAEFLGWRDRTAAFEDMAAFRQTTCVLGGEGGAEEDPCEVVSSNLFPLLGVAPLRGRDFSPAEDKAGGARVALLSYGLWQRRFGGDPGVIGRPLRLDGASATVVGVMPEDFSHLYASPYDTTPEMWVNGIALSPARTWNDYMAIGRLKAGVSPRQAEAEMDAVSLGIERAYPDLRGWRAQLMSLRVLTSGDTRSTLSVLMGAVTFVLLIACANVASLLLARGATRASEFAVRQALGASRGRLIRQLLTESLLIALAGGALGILLAFWGGKGLVALAPPFLLRSAPGLATAVLDLRVLAFALAASLATTLLFGLAPALQGAKARVTEGLKETSRTALPSPRGRRFLGALVASEIALAMVLLAGAGLMIRTVAQLGRVDLGFNPANVLTLRVPLSEARYQEPAARAEFWRRLVAAVETLPGVESSSVSRGLPIDDWAGQFFTTADHPDPPPGQVPDANYVVVGPHYFPTMQIPLRQGRAFDEHDVRSAEGVVIVNEELARSRWPGQDPLGKRLRMGTGASPFPWLSVVGVVGNVLSRGPDDGARAEVYVPYQQFPWLLSPQHLVVRTAAGLKPATLSRAVVEEVHRVDGDQPVADVRTMGQIAFMPIAGRRMVMALLGGFAGLALVLATLGIYGVVSYSVAHRTREIGLRLALGARPREVIGLMVGGGARLASLGIVAGVSGGLTLTQAMTDLLFNVRPTDPVTFGVVAILLAAASLLACYVPARRATRVDPMIALRWE